MTNCAEEEVHEGIPKQNPEENYRFLPNFILIYNGVLLSLSIRMITEEFMKIIGQIHIWEFFSNPDYKLILATVTLLLLLMTS